MEALPPQKSYEDFFEENILVAYMDLILAYPAEDIAFIGLFMMSVKYQKERNWFKNHKGCL